MATRVKNVGASASKTRIHYHSAIGTHRLKPRPLKNILYPYYRNYKPVYRARNPRTPLYYWPEIDKYPWNSHQKRYPKMEDINIAHFSEYTRRSSLVKTLYEVLHPLPLHGVNCLCWKEPKYGGEPSRSEDYESTPLDNKKIVNIGGRDYVVDPVARRNHYFLIKKVDYTTRPFRGKVTADLYVGESLIKRDVSPMGAVRGVWRYSFPYKLETARFGVNDRTLGDLALRVANIQIYRPNTIKTYGELVGTSAPLDNNV